MISVRLDRERCHRPGPPGRRDATLTQPGQPARRISLPRRGTAECLADELRRLDPDEIFEEAIRAGLGRISRSSPTASAAVREGDAPSPSEAKAEARRVAGRTAVRRARRWWRDAPRRAGLPERGPGQTGRRAQAGRKQAAPGAGCRHEGARAKGTTTKGTTPKGTTRKGTTTKGTSDEGTT